MNPTDANRDPNSFVLFRGFKFWFAFRKKGFKFICLLLVTEGLLFFIIYPFLNAKNQKKKKTITITPQSPSLLLLLLLFHIKEAKQNTHTFRFWWWWKEGLKTNKTYVCLFKQREKIFVWQGVESYFPLIPVIPVATILYLFD